MICTVPAALRQIDRLWVPSICTGHHSEGGLTSLVAVAEISTRRRNSGFTCVVKPIQGALRPASSQCSLL